MTIGNRSQHGVDKPIHVFTQWSNRTVTEREQTDPGVHAQSTIVPRRSGPELTTEIPDAVDRVQCVKGDGPKVVVIGHPDWKHCACMAGIRGLSDHQGLRQPVCDICKPDIATRISSLWKHPVEEILSARRFVVRRPIAKKLRANIVRPDVLRDIGQHRRGTAKKGQSRLTTRDRASIPSVIPCNWPLNTIRRFNRLSKCGLFSKRQNPCLPAISFPPIIRIRPLMIRDPRQYTEGVMVGM